MDKKTARVLKGWLNLSSSQRREFLEAIGVPYPELKDYEERELHAQVRKYHLGPLTDPCPCCGR